jgi:hypothetical protein
MKCLPHLDAEQLITWNPVWVKTCTLKGAGFKSLYRSEFLSVDVRLNPLSLCHFPKQLTDIDPDRLKPQPRARLPTYRPLVLRESGGFGPIH